MPVSPIKARRDHVVEQACLFLGEALRGLGPARAGLDRGLNHDCALLNPKLDFLAETSLLNQGFREANAARVANTDDACFHGITM